MQRQEMTLGAYLHFIIPGKNIRHDTSSKFEATVRYQLLTLLGECIKQIHANEHRRHTLPIPSSRLCRAWPQSRQYPLCHTVLHQLQGIDMHNGLLLQYLYFGCIEVACADQRSCLWPHRWFQCCRKPPIFKVKAECNGIGHASQKACCGRFHSVQIPVGIEPHHSWRPLRLSKTSNGANGMCTISLEHEHKTIVLRKSIFYHESGTFGNASQVGDTIARALRFRQLDPNNIAY